MPETITAYYSFTANTRARANEVETNFDNHRGHLIPITDTTAAASDNTHDLGTDEHRWRNAYLAKIDFRTSTTTASLILEGDTSVTTGAWNFKIEGVTKAVIDTNGIDGAYIKPLSYPTATIAHVSLQPRTVSISGSDTSPAGVIVSAGFSGSTTGAYNPISGSTVTISCVGRPVMVGIMGVKGDTASANNVMSCSAPATFTTSGFYVAQSNWYLYRNGSVICSWKINGSAIDMSGTSAKVLSSASNGPGVLAVDTDLTTGTNSYWLGATVAASTSVIISAGRLYAFEIY